MVTPSCTKIVSSTLARDSKEQDQLTNLLIVRLEMESCRLTTTQDMFLERVGITNSFNDDNEYRYLPFFVSDFRKIA